MWIHSPITKREKRNRKTGAQLILAGSLPEGVSNCLTNISYIMCFNFYVQYR